MLQIRGSDNRVYRPGRDLAFLFDPICRKAAYRLAATSWHSVIKDYAAFSGLTETALVDGAVCLAKFQKLCGNSDVPNFAAAFTNSGLAGLPHPVLLAVMFEVGLGTCAAFFNCVREAIKLGQASPGAGAVEDMAQRAAFAIKKGLPSEHRAATDEMNRVNVSYDSAHPAPKES
jgi:hypothetical protein